MKLRTPTIKEGDLGSIVKQTSRDLDIPPFLRKMK
jgi:hypothetical protein